MREKKTAIFTNTAIEMMLRKKAFVHARATAYRAYLQPIVQLGLWGSHWFMFEGVQSRRNFSFIAREKKNRSISRVFTQSDEDSGRLLPPPTGASFKPAVRSACNLYLTFLDMNSVFTKRKQIKYKTGEDHKFCAELRKKT